MLSIAELKKNVSVCQQQADAAQQGLRQAEENYHATVIQAQKLNQRIEHLRQFAGNSSKLTAAMADPDPLAQVVVFNVEALSMMIRSVSSIKSEAQDAVRARQSSLSTVEGGLRRAVNALAEAEREANKNSLAQIIKNAIKIE